MGALRWGSWRDTDRPLSGGSRFQGLAVPSLLSGKSCQERPLPDGNIFPGGRRSEWVHLVPFQWLCIIKTRKVAVSPPETSAVGTRRGEEAESHWEHFPHSGSGLLGVRITYPQQRKREAGHISLKAFPSCLWKLVPWRNKTEAKTALLGLYIQKLHNTNYLATLIHRLALTSQSWVCSTQGKSLQPPEMFQSFVGSRWTI